jgi:putative peptide zinc metalloprotease protein
MPGDPGQTKELEPSAPSRPHVLPDGDGPRAGPKAAEDANGASPAETRPKLAEGVELLGRYEGSGYRDPPFMARRPDGQMIQLPALLYLIAERADGNHTYELIARDVTEAVGRGLEAEDVEMLVEEKLRPLGILASADGSSPTLDKVNPLLSLRFRMGFVPETVTNAIAALFRPLFFPPVILAAVGGLVLLDSWLFFAHGFAQGVRNLIYQPLLLIVVFGCVVGAAALHEIGHAAACRYGGARPGVMGAGIYIVWPAFYTDITDAYRLSKGGRLRTDLGGVYFNVVFILLTAAAYFITGFEPLLIVIFVQHMEIVRQLLPLLRFDGYLVLSDLTGVPDLFSRMGPILVSTLPGKKPDRRVVELKPWVRLAVSLWVLVVVPILAFNVLMVLIYAPRIGTTGWDSFWLQLDRTTAAFGQGQAVAGWAGILQLIALGLPALGLVYTIGRVGTRVSKKVWTGTRERPVMRAAAAAAMVAGLVALGLVWWPDGDYKPVQPRERWTIPDAVAAAEETVAGHRAFASVPDHRLSTGTQVGSDVTPPPEPSPSPSCSASPSFGVTPSCSPSPSASASASPSVSPSPTASITPTPTATMSP